MKSLEFRIEQLKIQGVDFTYLDETTLTGDVLRYIESKVFYERKNQDKINLVNFLSKNHTINK